MELDKARVQKQIPKRFMTEEEFVAFLELLSLAVSVIKEQDKELRMLELIYGQMDKMIPHSSPPKMKEARKAVDELIEMISILAKYSGWEGVPKDGNGRPVSPEEAAGVHPVDDKPSASAD